MAVKQIEGYSIYMSKVLGKGSYGSVYLGKKEQTGENVAVKILGKQNIDSDDYLKAALKNEIEILQKVHSENIVGFYDVMESSKNYYIIQQLCDGDVCKSIDTNKELSESTCVDMLRQICNGFLALVQQGIIHRDLKPANILTKGKTLKIGDFGFAKQVQSKSMMHTTVGTPLYMSLQILKGDTYTSKCDIWALGFIFYQLLHGTTPWTANTEIQLVKHIETLPLKIKRKGLSAQTEDFLHRALTLKEQDRISWDEIFIHPIFKGFFANKSDQNQEFQNKLKMIMNKLRFYIAQKNLDLKKIIESLGYNDYQTEISFNQFFIFLQKAYPEITESQAMYVFRKTDKDNSKSISIEEIEIMLSENKIKFQSQFNVVPKFQPMKADDQTFLRISKETDRKIQGCFEKLYKVIKKNSLTLWKVFNDFDKKQGFLNLQQFTHLIQKLSQTSTSLKFNDEQIKSAFHMIDEDGSDSIEFQQLNKYYSKINGIPEEIIENLEYPNMKGSNKSINNQPYSPYSPHTPNTPQNPYNPNYNPNSNANQYPNSPPPPPAFYPNQQQPFFNNGVAFYNNLNSSNGNYIPPNNPYPNNPNNNFNQPQNIPFGGQSNGYAGNNQSGGYGQPYGYPQPENYPQNINNNLNYPNNQGNQCQTNNFNPFDFLAKKF